MSSLRSIGACVAVIFSALVPLLGQAEAPEQQTSSTLQRIKASGQIVLAHRASSIPFSYVDANGRPIGYAIDLCNRVVEAVRRELKLTALRVVYVPVDSASRITRLLDGTADIECGGTTNTAARREQVSFSVTHFFAGGRLLVRNTSGLQDISTMRYRTIAATKGSTHLRYLHEVSGSGLSQNRILEVGDPAAGLAAVESGAADAFLFDDVVLHALRADARTGPSLLVVGNWTTAEPLALMFRKDDAEFKRLIDKTLSRIMIDGEITSIYRKWFQAPIPPNGVVLDIDVSPLLRDQFRFPTDKVGDSASR
jgi:ABC-type amino acid transport substrate-binding protein